MEELQTIKINCPHCGHPLEYWTKNNYINCPKCNGVITVEPCIEIIVEEVEEIIEEDISEGNKNEIQ